MFEFLIIFTALVIGGVLGYVLRTFISILRKNTLEMTITEKMTEAKAHAQKILDEANKKIEEEKSQLRNIENHLNKKENTLDKRQLEIDEISKKIEQKIELVKSRADRAEQLVQDKENLLQQTASLTRDEAKEIILKEVAANNEKDIADYKHKLDVNGIEILKDRARDILVTAIQRLAVPMTNELTTTTVVIPNEESKGRIIGKEGRNIRAFETASGVELLIDEAPGCIIVSSFDPVRRVIAATALEALLKDGRIQPAKIEDELEKAKLGINDIIKAKGEEAVHECGIYNFDPRLIALLGRLHYRTSYGQNVLQHSIEMTHVAGMLARELGADIGIAKAGALVHDIGKALDHEFEGTHIDIGIKVLRRFQTDERVITAMKSHHDDCPHETVEAVIVQTADMISGARPGARRDSAENYLKRLEDLENIAMSFKGVEKVYALQAGRELRVFVRPENLNDFESQKTARNIALEIEKNLKYPGQIKITVIRETRVIDYAR